MNHRVFSFNGVPEVLHVHSYLCYFPLSLSDCSNTSILSSSLYVMRSVWSSLLERLATGIFLWLTCFSFPEFSVWYFSGFCIFLEFLFNILYYLPYFIYMFISILLEFIQLFIFSLNALMCLYMSSLVSFAHYYNIWVLCALIFFIILVPQWCCWLWRCHFALFCAYFLCFCIGVCASEAKSLTGSFNHLYSFGWSVLSIQAGLCSGGVVMWFLTTGLRYN
jgi:hypothetical protein